MSMLVLLLWMVQSCCQYAIPVTPQVTTNTSLEGRKTGLQ